MSEQFKVAANAEDFLGQVDEAKKAQEAASFWSQQLGEDIIDGDRDSEQSKQRIGEVDEYAQHLQGLSERDEAYDALSADDGTERNSLSNQSLKDLAEAAKKAHADGNEQGSMILQDAIQEKLINKYGEMVLASNGEFTQEQADAAILNQIDSIGRIISGEHTDGVVASDGEAHVKPSATFASAENNPGVQVVFSDNETPVVLGVREAGASEEDLTSFETEAPSESEVAEDARVAALAAAEKASQNVQNEVQPPSPEQGTGDQTTEVLPLRTMDREAVANFVAQAASNNVQNAVNAAPGAGERDIQNTAEVEDHEEESTASSQKASRGGLAKFIKNAKNVARAKRVKAIQKSNEAPVDQSDDSEPVVDDSGKKTTLLGRLRRAAQESFKAKSSDATETEDVLTTPITNVNGGEVSSPADENTTDVVPRRVERSADPEPLTVTAYSEVPNGYYGVPQAARSEDAPTTTVIPQRDASQASFRRS